MQTSYVFFLSLFFIVNNRNIEKKTKVKLEHVMEI